MSGVLSGTVTFKSDGSSVSGADVFVVASDGNVYHTTTDSNGDYSLTVPSGDAHVLISYEDGNDNTFRGESKPFVNVS